MEDFTHLGQEAAPAESAPSAEEKPAEEEVVDLAEKGETGEDKGEVKRKSKKEATADFGFGGTASDGEMSYRQTTQQ